MERTVENRRSLPGEKPVRMPLFPPRITEQLRITFNYNL